MGRISRILTAIAALLLLFLNPVTIAAGFAFLLGAVALTFISNKRRPT